MNAAVYFIAFQSKALSAVIGDRFSVGSAALVRLLAGELGQCYESAINRQLGVRGVVITGMANFLENRATSPAQA